MRIAYLVSEFGLWGSRGGYGSIARAVAAGMARRGHDVFALVPKRGDMARLDPRETIPVDDVTAIALPDSYPGRLRARRLYRAPEADLFVSLDPRFDSWWAMQCAPRAKHAVWLLDPMSFDAYWKRHRGDPRLARFGEKTATRVAFETLRAFGRAALRRADAVWRQPESLPDAARSAVRLSRETRHAPNPVAIPREPIRKASLPLVLFLGRLDWQKQPERFFDLARRLPEIAFVAAGAASDASDDAKLRAAARDIPNLTLAGHVRDAEKDALLCEAWIVCNTSLREGLPHSLQEALAYGCALVARVDPDGLVSRFGLRVEDDAFEAAVTRLLEGDDWQHRGAQGRAWIAKHYSAETALDTHETLARELVS